MSDGEPTGNVEQVQSTPVIQGGAGDGPGTATPPDQGAGRLMELESPEGILPGSGDGPGTGDPPPQSPPR